MAEDRPNPYPTLALNTKVEDDFVAPLTAMRGSLEILRDVPDLAEDERRQFLDSALRGCARLEAAIDELAKSVYAAGQKAASEETTPGVATESSVYSGRIKVLDDLHAIDIDFSDFEFSNSKIVDDFYDVIDERIRTSGRDWYIMVNYHNCSIWPEAWVAFAHRGKKVNVNHSLGTVRYTACQESEDGAVKRSQSDSLDPNILDSREAALLEIKRLKSAKRG